MTKVFDLVYIDRYINVCTHTFEGCPHFKLVLRISKRVTTLILNCKGSHFQPIFKSVQMLLCMCTHACKINCVYYMWDRCVYVYLWIPFFCCPDGGEWPILLRGVLRAHACRRRSGRHEREENLRKGKRLMLVVCCLSLGVVMSDYTNLFLRRSSLFIYSILIPAGKWCALNHWVL